MTEPTKARKRVPAYEGTLRSHMIMANGVGLNTGMLVSVIILVVAVIVGGLVFQRRDILKGEG